MLSAHSQKGHPQLAAPSQGARSCLIPQAAACFAYTHTSPLVRKPVKGRTDEIWVVGAVVLRWGVPGGTLILGSAYYGFD